MRPGLQDTEMLARRRDVLTYSFDHVRVWGNSPLEELVKGLDVVCL